MDAPGKVLKNGIIDNNPIFMQAIGLCPTLAVTTSSINGLGMGLATTAVLMGSNCAISLLRKLIPTAVRIPIFVIVISSFVTVIQFLLKGFIPSLDKSLGLFIPLIAVNCIIFARAESYAFKHKPLMSIIDGFAMGIGFTLALTIIGSVRELFGNGSLFDVVILPEAFPQTLIMIMPPGAFITLGLIMAVINYFRLRKEARA